MPNLNIRINTRGGETKTAQIFNQIAGAITNGRLSVGDTIPSERGLAERLGVSRNIVRNAYERLEHEGLVETVSTAGRRVRGRSRKGAVAGRGAQGKGAAKRSVASGRA